MLLGLHTYIVFSYCRDMRKLKHALTACAVALSLITMGCSSQEIPPAHKGRMFDKTGALAFYAGGDGFEGPVLGPGTYYTGVYPEVRLVDCGQYAPKEPLTALTKDGVQFSLDVYVTFSANCDEEKSVVAILEKLAPDGIPAEKPADGAALAVVHADLKLTVTSAQLYRVFIRPAIGEAVRQAVSPYVANDVNAKREEIFEKIKKNFDEILAKQDPKVIVLHGPGLNLSNLDFPQAMDDANAKRAVVAIERDTSQAEQEKIKVQIETAKLEVTRAEVMAEATAKKIDVEGAALRRNQEWYLRDVYYWAAKEGGTVVLPSDPNVLMQITTRGRK